MLPIFQRASWTSKLCWPDWYIRSEQELTSLIFPTVHDDTQLKAWRQQLYQLVGEMLARNEIPLADTGPNLDIERRAIDTFIIHHTEEEPDISLDTLSAIGLLRQYSPHYLDDDVLGHRVRGQPVWSGHFRAGRMVFFAYHWLIRQDGTCERLLEDSAIGWHAGNWEINTRSVGIALSGNYEHARPPAAQLAATAHVLQTYYPTFARERVLGHRELRADLTCPGEFFLHGWRQELLALL